MSNHIENLKISNFKCFKELEVSNIGRVNLIGGKNNVGKTAFLEAVELFVSSNEIYDLVKSITNMLIKRQKKTDSLELDFINNVNECAKILSTSKSFDMTRYNDLLSLSITKSGKCKKVSILIDEIIQKPRRPILMHDSQGFLIGTQNLPVENVSFISSSTEDEQDIAISFGALIELGIENFLNKSLSLFDENIIELKVIPKENNRNLLKLRLKNKDPLVLLSSLGEGINRYITILCAIWASKDSVLLIDEIENGIHYTNYKKLWQIIFQASVDANCQIFITTHSKECIEAFNQVQCENENCNAQYFEFYHSLKKGLIVASNISKERLQYSLTHEGQVRGE